MKLNQRKALFENEVLTRFDLFKSLFLTLPFQRVKDTGTILPFFTVHCEKGVKENLSPEEIINDFFEQYGKYIKEEDKIDLLFRIIQYIERQVVLFDAIEDASFQSIGRSTDDTGTLESLISLTQSDPEIKDKVIEKIKDFSIRLVLTAHPTQFYPGPVLAIINDLIEALKNNDIHNIQLLLQQLGKTPFINKEKPKPEDEAASLAWFLENVFYKVASDLQSRLDGELDLPFEELKGLVELGFWPGGDRDGNPNVSVDSTKKVAMMLRTILFRCYYRDFRMVKRRITFRGVAEYMNALQELLYENSFNPQDNPQDETDNILYNLKAIRKVLNEDHEGLFVELVEDLIRKVNTFGCYFSTLDMRQDSSVLRNTYLYLDNKINHTNHGEDTQIRLEDISLSEHGPVTEEADDPLIQDTNEIIRLIQEIQKSGSEKAAQRFIISNCQEAYDILLLKQLFLWNGWKKDNLTIDFVPLFETIDDLIRASDVMKALYTHKEYREHLKNRGNRQTIMLGYSDSTKDGGYLMANWSIYKAKVELSALAREHGIDLVFFDGRGGPPARGGGKTQRFYASMGKEIENDHIQLTIQGQIISSQYGSIDAASYNIEQLLCAGILSDIKKNPGDTLSQQQKEVIQQIADTSHQKFTDLREHGKFLSYLEKMSPLKYLSMINISSRPVKRNANRELRLEDLRMISFVTAWSQLKQNIPGFYGVGTALKWAFENDLWSEVENLYQTSGMFNTLIDNCMMSMTKTNFNITSHLVDDEEFGDFWQLLKDEYDLTLEYLLKLSRSSSLMENYPVEKESILIREKIVLPLIVIQHFGIRHLLNDEVKDEEREIYKKLIGRTIYGVINAGRNIA